MHVRAVKRRWAPARSELGVGRAFAVASELFVLLSGAALASEPVAAPIFAVPSIANEPAIDGTIGASWERAATLALTTDFTNRRPADEPTTVRVAQDDGGLDVAFDVTQREALLAATTTNGANVQGDDYVAVALSPDGPQGFQYVFYANSRGARYQTSSENSSYAPPWQAAVKTRADGYTVTMRIPFAIVRSGGRTAWRVQFERSTVRTNALDVWAFDPRASGVGDATFFGTITGVGERASGVATRPKARAQVYALGERTTPAYGGDTSRAGADLAIPIAPTISLLGSFHPDNSNVETDQQTIAPTAFVHEYAEVRPFFTQAAQSFNSTFSCDNCVQLLYTPSIPTYRNAYAVEGAQGPLTFAAFDAAGIGRDDAAETLNFGVSNTQRAVAFNVQNVTVNLDGGVRDQVSSLATGYANQHTNFFTWLNAATESGSAITSPGLATYAQGGIGYSTATTAVNVGWQHIGAQFAPFDAYVAQNDIDGPQLFAEKTYPFKASDVVHDVQLQTYEASFMNHLNQPSQNDLFGQAQVDLRDLVTIRGFLGEEAVRTYADEFLPFDTSGGTIGYKLATATPSNLTYYGGPYFHGTLDAWVYRTTLTLAPKIHLALETDRNSYFTHYPGESSGTQYLERASLDYQINREMQFDIGARRLIGQPLPVSFQAPVFTSTDQSNLTAAFHYLARSGHDEVYVVYGDPNALTTTPALFLKYVLYLGAPKGT